MSEGNGPGRTGKARWGQVPEAAIADGKLSDRALRLLAWYCVVMDYGTRIVSWTDANTSTTAEDLSWHPSEARRHRQDLEKAGYIEMRWLNRRAFEVFVVPPPYQNDSSHSAIVNPLESADSSQPPLVTPVIVLESSPVPPHTPPLVFLVPEEPEPSAPSRAEFTLEPSPHVNGAKHPKKPPAGPRREDVLAIFDHWVAAMGKPRAKTKLTPERQKVIEGRLRDYTVADLKTAIDGCASDPWSRGENDRHKAFDDLTLILRNGTKVEEFMAMAPVDVTPAAEAVLDSPAAVLKRYRDRLKVLNALPSGHPDEANLRAELAGLLARIEGKEATAHG